MAHSFRRSVALTLFLFLVAASAWGPKVTVRDVLSSGAQAGRDVSASVDAPRVPAAAGMPTRPWTPMCQAMKDRLRDPDMEIERKRVLAQTFRNSCL